MFSLEAFHQAYETDTVAIVVDGRQFDILLPKNLSDFINIEDVLQHFPLWAKAWKASWILAGYLAAIPVENEKRYLEIGGGLGLVSIAAAARGHRITMTEYNPDALQFARANAHLNNCPDLPIVELDWVHPQLCGKFDSIVASEIIYKEESFPLLLKVFRKYLKKDGEIILASEMRKIIGGFCDYVHPFFHINVQKKILRSADQKTTVLLIRLKPKKIIPP